MALKDSGSSSFPLRLHFSMRRQLDEMARSEGISLNHLISLAIAEKLTRYEQHHLQVDDADSQTFPALNPPKRS